MKFVLLIIEIYSP